MISPVIATFLRRWWFRKHLWQRIRAAGMGVAIAAAAYWTAWTAWELARAGGDPMLRDLVRGDLLVWLYWGFRPLLVYGVAGYIGIPLLSFFLGLNESAGGRIFLAALMVVLISGLAWSVFAALA